jgi:hypothetical protein
VRLVYTPKMSAWTNFVKKTYMDMKKKNKNTSLKDAMKNCSKLWKSKTAKATPKVSKKGRRKTARKGK